MFLFFLKIATPETVCSIPGLARKFDTSAATDEVNSNICSYFSFFVNLGSNMDFFWLSRGRIFIIIKRRRYAILRGSRSKSVALTILFLFVVNACHSQGYSDLVGKWSANSESHGELGLFLYEDSSMVIVEDENEYRGPVKLHQANGGTVQLHIEEYQLKARYQSPSGSTVLWALLDDGESLIELVRCHKKILSLKF